MHVDVIAEVTCSYHDDDTLSQLLKLNQRLKLIDRLHAQHVEHPLITDKRIFQWTGNGHSQLPLAELGKPSPNIDLLHNTGSNGRA